MKRRAAACDFLVSMSTTTPRAKARGRSERSLKVCALRIDLILHGAGPSVGKPGGFLCVAKGGKIDYGEATGSRRNAELCPGRRTGVATDQLLYNLTRRGIEWDLLPWLRKRRVVVMAYSPIEQAKLLRNPKLIDFAKRYDRAPAQAALAWLLANDDIIAIPMTGKRERLKENFGALDHPLTKEHLAELDQLFAPPQGPVPLQML